MHPTGLAGLAQDEFVKTWSRELPRATACFEDDFEACIAHLRLPIGHRQAIRTTNLLERMFGEERRRTKGKGTATHFEAPMLSAQMPLYREFFGL